MIDSRTSGAIGGAAQGASMGSAFGPWGAVIGGVAGGLFGALGGGGEDDAKELAEERARLIQMTARENERRALLQLGGILGEAKAATYASNLQDSGSSKRYRTELESRFRQEMAWDRQKARIDAKMARKGGQVAADQIQYSSISSMIGGAGSLVGSGAFSGFGGGGGGFQQKSQSIGMNVGTGLKGIGL